MPLLFVELDNCYESAQVLAVTSCGSGPTSVVCLIPVTLGLAGRSREIVWKLPVPTAFGLMVLDCDAISPPSPPASHCREAPASSKAPSTGSK